MENTKLWDWVVWNQRFKWKTFELFVPLKKKNFCLCMYKMNLISAEGYKNAKVEFLPITGKIWVVSMKDVGNGIGVTMEENLLLLRDLLEHWKTRFWSTWQLFQKMFISMF